MSRTRPPRKPSARSPSARPPTWARAWCPPRRAFPAWSQTSREERLEVLGRILAEYQKRFGDLATAVTEEMGAPTSLSQRAQVPAGMGHLATAAQILKEFKSEED